MWPKNEVSKATAAAALHTDARSKRWARWGDVLEIVVASCLAITLVALAWEVFAPSVFDPTDEESAATVANTSALH